MIEILHRYTKAVLYSADVENLYDADLYGADLYGADLSDADLSDANLRGADLSDADLSDANLSDANLSDANLSDANLRGANLRGANLRGANLYGADLREKSIPGAPPVKALRAQVADLIEAHPELHDQGTWGNGKADPACGTPCCVAGWACHLGGGDRNLGVETAATLLLWDKDLPMPNFAAGATREEILTALRATVK